MCFGWSSPAIIAGPEERDPGQGAPQQPFLAREAGSGTRAIAPAALGGKGIELAPAVELSSAESLMRAVLAGGFALLSERVVEREVARLVPTLWIVLGPLGQSITAARTARQGCPGRYRSSIWWSFTFPVGTMVTGTSLLALSTHAVVLDYGSVALYALLVVASLTAATRTARGALDGRLFLPAPPSAGAAVGMARAA
jgi:hypothetical protein